jgi:hypothetical protein
MAKKTEVTTWVTRYAVQVSNLDNSELTFLFEAEIHPRPPSKCKRPWRNGSRG